MQEQNKTDNIIWASIKDIWNYGFSYNQGEDNVFISIGLFLLVVMAFILTSVFLKISITLSSGSDITILLTASAAKFIGLVLALQRLYQDIDSRRNKNSVPFPQRDVHIFNNNLLNE